ncbi:uncharacterized protein LOC122250787 [Penaeus japonicus]|uniref:uncharacterized protein LOC122250787 n=1 Tax=Penaeus japonicus TaxID=27405 RepID=UPI001C71547E|nr:uncharacterized protein LOC122250787 [Penaeus japonicus]
MWFSYPYGKECCHILLQTIPGHIDVEEFQARFLQEFPAIVNVHHLHIWTFTPENVVATAHVVFSRARVYLNMKAALTHFFHEEGITKVTLQPEYLEVGTDGALDTTMPTKGQVCLLRCQNEHCYEKECCHDRCHQELTSISTTRPRAVTTTNASEESVTSNTRYAMMTGASGRQVNSRAGEGDSLHGEQKSVQPKNQKENPDVEQPEENVPFLQSENSSNDNDEQLNGERPKNCPRVDYSQYSKNRERCNYAFVSNCIKWHNLHLKITPSFYTTVDCLNCTRNRKASFYWVT